MISLPAGLTMNTTPALVAGFCEQVGAAAKAGAGAQVDCSNMGTGFDSSAVALLVAASRSAATNGGVLTLLNVPENLRKLATLYGVDSLLFPGAQ
jgi:phospholipid transport system transporter-binding protein